MPGIRFIFGSIALSFGLYGLIRVQTPTTAQSIERYDQPQRVQVLIARAYNDPGPDDRRDIARQLERELVASLNEPNYFGR